MQILLLTIISYAAQTTMQPCLITPLSLQVAHKIRTEGDVLVGAGAHFGVEHHLRITHGMEPEFLEGALQSISRVLASASAAESK